MYTSAIGLIVTIVVIAISFFKWTYTYWSRKGLPTLKPQIPFGDAKKLMTAKCSFGEQFQDFYKQLKEQRHGGVYLGPKPFYIPTDPELIKNILQNDFGHFMNHGVYYNLKDDPLTGHLFNLEGTKWRNTRVKLTPTFTSGKMKMMFETLAKCCDGLKTIMTESANNHVPVDIKDVLGRFTTDIIGSCAFGLECDSLKDPNAVFRQHGRKIFEFTGIDRVKFLLQFLLPHDILRMFKMKIIKTDVAEFFKNAIKNTVKYREENNVYRKDFLHLLLQLKNRGSVQDDEKIKDDNGTTVEKLTINELAAHSFVFFGAGFETSSTTMTWTLYELATNPEVQDKLRKETRQVLDKYGNDLTYDAIMEMTYMDKVIQETLRKYPPIPILARLCTKSYTVPNTNVSIENGTSVMIPTLGIHMDPEYYPNPEKFDPDRFSEENKKTRPAFTWLPFGEGPRMCIGLRFGMLQSKVGLVTLLNNYKIKLNRKTQIPIKLDKQSFITAADGGIWIDVEELNK